LNDLSRYGLTDEPIISESISAGADVVSFSGDKLLGASQAGLIVGRREIVERLRKHSLYRALRVDKLCLAALEATLETHRRGAIEEIPALRMLSVPMDIIEKRAVQFTRQLGVANSHGVTATVVSGQSAIGGGCGPNTHPETALIALKHKTMNAEEIERRLRLSATPVIARIADGSVLLDLRTVEPNEEPNLLKAITSIADN
jgi:L-seryl-tRNA(Ser) seleniumtransferase